MVAADEKRASNSADVDSNKTGNSRDSSASSSDRDSDGESDRGSDISEQAAYPGGPHSDTHLLDGTCFAPTSSLHTAI